MPVKQKPWRQFPLSFLLFFFFLLFAFSTSSSSRNEGAVCLSVRVYVDNLFFVKEGQGSRVFVIFCNERKYEIASRRRSLVRFVLFY